MLDPILSKLLGNSKIDPAIIISVFIVAVLFGMFYLGYRVGLEKGFIPKAELCKQEILTVAECEKQKMECTKDLAECKIRKNTDCMIDFCTGECAKQVKDALEKYKQLRHRIICKGQ